MMTIKAGAGLLQVLSQVVKIEEPEFPPVLDKTFGRLSEYCFKILGQQKRVVVLGIGLSNGI